MAWRLRGDKPLSESLMLDLLTNICVTRLQRVNIVKWRKIQIYVYDSLNKFSEQKLSLFMFRVAHLNLWTQYQKDKTSTNTPVAASVFQCNTSTKFSNAFSEMEVIELWSNVTENCPKWSNWWYASKVPCNDLELNEPQFISWSND